MACFCGHIEEEHDAHTGTCEVEGCECACFEPEEDEEDDERE